MPTKTTMRFHLTSVRMAIIKKTTNKCWWGGGEKGTLVNCWWEYKLVQPVWKTLSTFLKKMKIELSYDPAIPILGIYPKKIEKLFQKNSCIPMFIAALFTTAKIRKQPKCPSTDKWITKIWYIYIMEYCSAIKKNEILPFTTMQMDLEGIMLSETSQTEKGKHCMI